MEKPSISTILKSDYTSRVWVWMFGVSLVVFLAIMVGRQIFADSDSTISFFYISVPFLLFLLPLIGRINIIYRTFSKGKRIEGVVEQIRQSRPYVLLEYRFTWQGKDYGQKLYVPNNKWSRSLQVSRPITIIFDPGKPKHSFVQQVFLS